MSMLAERKQKQKWTLNPRGKLWSDDANKFGQKMLEKMGWTSGKGLGANEDGITEHIKQSYKNDSKGIGFEDKGDQWTRHEVDFSSLLQNLSDNKDTSLKKPEISLEKKSQISKVRVHYHKFTRGKDLSRYSEKDLANVFGRKTLTKQNVEKCQIEQENSKENKEFGVMTVNGGNMAEYFKNKFKSVIKKPLEDEFDVERPAFGFGYETNLPNDSIGEEITPEENNLDDNVDIPKKKKKKTKVVINECFDNPGFTDFTDVEKTCEANPEEITISNNMAFDNPGLDLNFTKENDDLQSINKKKKNKKRKLETIVEEANPDIEDEFVSKKRKKEEKQVNDESDLKKSKKRLKKNKGIDNSACSEIFMDEKEELEEKMEKKLKKSKKNKGIDNPACSEIFTDEKEDLEEKMEKKLKKSKKNKGIDNPEDMEKEDMEDKMDKRVKKSKKNKGLDNLAFTETSVQEIDNVECENEEKNEEKDKKKKKSKNLDNGVDNLACTANSVEQNIEETIASMSNAIDDYQLELENQMNEKKAKKQINNLKNSRLREKFINPRKSVKDVIQGKIKYNFEGSNLANIPGYGVYR